MELGQYPPPPGNKSKTWNTYRTPVSNRSLKPCAGQAQAGPAPVSSMPLRHHILKNSPWNFSRSLCLPGIRSQHWRATLSPGR